MRIMNGNDSVVKCLCFFRFLLSVTPLPEPRVFIYTASEGSVTGVVWCGHRPPHGSMDVGRWTHPSQEQSVCVWFSVIRSQCIGE